MNRSRNPIQLMKDYLGDSSALEPLQEAGLEASMEQRSSSPLTPELARIVAEAIRFFTEVDGHCARKE